MKGQKELLAYKNKIPINREKYPHLKFCLENLELPKSIYRFFKKNGFEYLSDICTMDYYSLKSIKGVGESKAIKTVKEIEKYKNLIDVNDNTGLYSFIKELITELENSDLKNYSPKIIFQMNILFDKDKGLLIDNFVTNLYKKPECEVLLKEHIYSLLSYDSGTNIKDVLSTLPNHLRNNNLIELLLNEMKEEAININYPYLTCIHPSVTVYVEKHIKGRDKEILLKRLSGATLEEIGEEFSLTRERVRQLIKKQLKRSIQFDEDKYKSIYEEYNINRKDFLLIFDEKETTYNYLRMLYKSGEKDLEEMLDNDNFNINIKRRIEKAIYRNYIDLGDKKVKINREEIVKYVIRTYAKDSINISEFTELYNLVLDDYNLLGNPKLEILEGTISNKLRNSKYALWNRGNNIRYYNLKSQDFTNFLLDLKLNEYRNIELSTRKIFCDHSDLMKEYDIRDEYELHNLLKKICSKDDYGQMKFSRMPMIKFGNANRSKQVRELLFEIAPIKINDFAEKYEKKYGVLVKTVLANYVQCIGEYYHDGEYTVNSPILSDENMLMLKQFLTEDYYTMSCIKDIFKKILPDINSKFFNPFTLRKLGFHVYSDYIINNKYKNSLTFFKHFIAKNDFLDLNTISKDVLNNNQFQACLSNMRKDYEIIEYERHKYISIKKLESVGCDKDTLKDYCDYINKKVSENYFTVFYTRKKGIYHDIYKLGFSERFYESILSEDRTRLNYQRVDNTKLFRKGDQKSSWIDLIETIIYSTEKLSIDIYDLQDLLKEEYNIYLDTHKIIENIENSSLFYSRITEKAYGDYEIYFDEI